MLRLILSLSLMVLPISAFSYDDPYSTKPKEIEIRNTYDPGNNYRGDVDSFGTARLRNSNGDTLKGDIDKDGYGTLRDYNGNSYRVRPK